MNRYQSQMIAAGMVCTGLFLCGGAANGTTEGEPAPLPAPLTESQTVAAPEKPQPPPKNPELALAEELFGNGNYAKAVKIFRKLAAAGDPAAAAWLGKCYMNGLGTEQDDEMAYRFFEQSARKNHPMGITGLGECNELGRGTPKNLQEAYRLYQKAADLDYPLGALKLALACANDDARKAEKYFKKAIELGEPAGAIRYAGFLVDRKRYPEAILLLQGSMDHPDAMYMMAMCYQYGTGVKVNIAKAADLAEKHYRKVGAAPWSAETCFNAGLEEFIIRGRVRNDQVKRRFKCAAEQGHPRAQYHYAKFLVDDYDHNGALTYMLRSADQGYHPAMLEVGKMFAARKEYSKAIKYFMLASTSAKPGIKREAVERISYIYHYDLKTPKAGMPWDVMGVALNSAFCRNRIADNELNASKRNADKKLNAKRDEHLAKAAALFTEGMINNNEFASKKLDFILENRYETLRRLADDGNADALFVLGILGCKEKQSVVIGLELLEKSAKRNHASACRILGNLFWNGKIVKEDLKKAFYWYRKGAAAGDAGSARLAARLLFLNRNGAFKKTDLALIKKVFDKALELEAFDVAYEYGLITEERTKDQKRAVELYRLAADHNNTRAMRRLCELCVETDLRQAVALMRQAADLDDTTAELEMGDFYRLPANARPRDAFVYYLRASLHGDEKNAPYKLAECWLTGYGCDVNHEYFWKSAEKAFRNGCVEVCHLLGTVYRDGKICPRDMEKAKAYFQEGAKRGSKRCREELKKL